MPECVFNNPHALSPGAAPSALRCHRSFPTDSAGTCRIGPNKHGDACNVNGECASGNCQTGLKQCKGVDEGEVCVPSLPDSCQPNFFCRASAGSATGRCSFVSNPGKVCTTSESCALGYYCTGTGLVGERRCIAPFTVPTGSNTTIGPFMCATANALMIERGPSAAESVYACRALNETSLIGRPCNARLAQPLGYECACAGAASGFRLRTIGSLGLGARSTVWQELFACLRSATGTTGLPCEFDSIDMTEVRCA